MKKKIKVGFIIAAMVLTFFMAEASSGDDDREILPFTSVPCGVTLPTIKMSLKSKCQSGGDNSTTGRTGTCCKRRRNAGQGVQCI